MFVENLHNSMNAVKFYTLSLKILIFFGQPLLMNKMDVEKYQNHSFPNVTCNGFFVVHCS